MQFVYPQLRSRIISTKDAEKHNCTILASTTYKYTQFNVNDIELKPETYYASFNSFF